MHSLCRGCACQTTHLPSQPANTGAAAATGRCTHVQSPKALWKNRSIPRLVRTSAMALAKAYTKPLQCTNQEDGPDDAVGLGSNFGRLQERIQ